MSNTRLEYMRAWRKRRGKLLTDYQREYRRKYRAEGRDKWLNEKVGKK
jgi:hypothetical protein